MACPCSGLRSRAPVNDLPPTGSSPKKAKDTLVAYCTARTLTIGVRGHCADQDALIAQLGVDSAGYWRPTRDNYLARLTKGALFAQFGPLIGQQ